MTAYLILMFDVRENKHVLMYTSDSADGMTRGFHLPVLPVVVTQCRGETFEDAISYLIQGMKARMKYDCALREMVDKYAEPALRARLNGESPLTQTLYVVEPK
jgi:hypothetical protein